jgi:uncharacterized membrane protein (DUF2068 family)
MDRPLGVVLVSILSAFFGAVIFVAGLVGTAFPSLLPIDSWLGFSLFIVGALAIATAYGLWTFQRWGRGLTIVTNVISIPQGILMDGRLGLVDVFGIAHSVMIIGYLCTPKIKKLYAKSSAPVGP